MTSGTADSGRRYDVATLIAGVSAIFKAAAMEAEKADAVAEILVEADTMGRRTHGVALAPFYLEAATSGAMALSGAPDVVSDRGGCITWRGRRLPGPWLVREAVGLALERVRQHGIATVAISDSHHIGALSAYLRQATEQGCMIQIASSVPSVRGVAPFGAAQAVLTPNPFAAGVPTSADPILIDVSASITTINAAKQTAKAGGRFPQPWAIEADGRPTDDPNAVLERAGTLLPAGGLDHGHKGYAWALIAEALSQGLPGYGRADAPKGTSLSVFIQVIDPEAFAGLKAFERQSDFLVDACRAATPLPGHDAVRVPGDRAMDLRRDALAHGVPLSPAAAEGLDTWADRFGLPTFQPVA